MKFKRYGKEIPGILEKEMEISVINYAKGSILKKLNYLLGMIKKQYSISEYVDNLEKKFKSMATEDYISKIEFDINKTLTDFDNLKEYPKLATYYINYFLQLLKITEKDEWTKENVKIVHKNYLCSFLLPNYYSLQVLTETIGRDEAIQLYQIFVTQYINDNLSPNRKIFDTMEDFKEHFETDKKDVTIGWYGYLSEVKNGKFFFRKDNCLWADVLIDLPDKALKYLTCCYGDFQAAATRGKDNFVLTMKHTIVEGNPYCDCIYHNTDVDWDLTHPPKEFWDDIDSKK
ncbi:MAG: hypothetical protein ACTSP5_02815 [Candidatus Heimdallarchaeota archaeon]